MEFEEARPFMESNHPGVILHALAKLLASWLLATYQPSPTAGPTPQGSLGMAEEDVELGLYLLR